MTLTLNEVAERLHGVLAGDGSAAVHALASLAEARPGDLSFYKDAKYARLLAATKATAILVEPEWQGETSAKAVIRVKDPNGAFGVAAAWFAPPEVVRKPGIHPTAIIAPSAKIGARAHIGPWTVIEDGAVIGDDAVIEAQVFIGERVAIGSRVHLYPQVSIREGCILGDRVILHCGVRIGGDGYGYDPVFLPNGTIRVDKIPQLGIVELGDDVEIGSNATVDRARFGRTRIGNSTKIDNLVQIGHNVQIGDYSGVIAQAGVAGSAIIGSGCLIWAQAGVSGHLTIHDRAQVGPSAGVTKDVAPGEYVLGQPAVPKKEFVRQLLLPRQVEKLERKIGELSARIAELEARK